MTIVHHARLYDVAWICAVILTLQLLFHGNYKQILQPGVGAAFYTSVRRRYAILQVVAAVIDLGLEELKSSHHRERERIIYIINIMWGTQPAR